MSQGRAYIMVTREFYEHYLPDYSQPEMQVSHCSQVFCDGCHFVTSPQFDVGFVCPVMWIVVCLKGVVEVWSSCF